MKLRAAIFDVYGTLLEIGPPPPDREERWQRLWSEAFGGRARLSLAEFEQAAAAEVESCHAAAHAVGIPYPEVYWPEIIEKVVPELEKGEAGRCLRWRHEQPRLNHSVRLASGAAEVLGAWHARGVSLGIASNAQPYTLGELGAALKGAGLDMGLFSHSLIFWSFENGFSKPDPHVFRLLGARLASMGIEKTDTLMVGDRLDNDVSPALAQGWSAWHLAPGGAQGGVAQGDWAALGESFQV